MGDYMGKRKMSMEEAIQQKRQQHISIMKAIERNKIVIRIEDFKDMK